MSLIFNRNNYQKYSLSNYFNKKYKLLSWYPVFPGPSKGPKLNIEITTGANNFVFWYKKLDFIYYHCSKTKKSRKIYFICG